MNIFVKEKAFYARFFRLTGAVALQNLILLGVSLCDNLMLGGYSELAMSGAAVAIQFQFLLTQTLTGIGSGAVVIAAQHWGRRQREPVARTFAVAFALALAVGCAFGAAGFFFPERVLGLLTNEAGVIEQGAIYLRTLAPTYPLFALTAVGTALFRCIESPRVGVYISLAALGIDAVLNYLLIYGKLGLPRLGIYGAALATVISYVVQFALLVFFLFRIDKKLRMRPREAFKIERKYIGIYARVALPLVGSAVSWGLAMNMQSAILGRMGQASIAANAIAAALFQVCAVVIYGAASASNVIIGKTVGEGDIPKVKAYTRTMQALFLSLGLCTGAALFTARGLIIDFYNIAPETRGLALQFMLVLSVTVVGTSYQMTGLAGIVTGGGDTRFVLINDLIFQWCVVLPFSALSAFVWQFPPLVTFMILKSDQILKCAVAAVKVNRFRWIKNLTGSGLVNVEIEQQPQHDDEHVHQG